MASPVRSRTDTVRRSRIRSAHPTTRPSLDRFAAAVDDTVLAWIAQSPWVSFSLSGGKDSGAAAAAANWLLDRLGHPRSRRLCIHADLGRGDWASTGRTVEAIADHLRLPLVIVRHQRYDMISRWEARFDSGLRRYAMLETLNLVGPWSSARLRFCTSDLKASLITAEMLRRFAGEPFISVVGIRREESPNRRAAPISLDEPRYRRRNGTRGMTWHPVVDWTADDVFALHAREHLPLHEAYTQWGTSRLSCRFCILASHSDLTACSSAPDNHDVYRHLVRLEARSTFSFQPGRWLGSIAPHLLDADLAAALALGRQRADERRSIEASLPSDLRYVSGWPPRKPTRIEAEHLAAARQRIARHHDLDLHYTTPTAVIDRFAELMALQRRR